MGSTVSTTRPNCESITTKQNARLGDLCKKKVNLLPCRCTSGCDSDDRFPVIGSPSDAPLLNTAYDGDGGFIPSGGGTDRQWEVALGGPSGPGSVNTPWIPAFVIKDGAWVASPFSNANWISYYVDSDQGAGNRDAYFRYRFNLGASVDPSSFAVVMDFYADNRVWDIEVNGVSQQSLPNGAGVLPQFPDKDQTEYQTRGFEAGNQVHITLDNSWRRCDNEIIVHVMSGPFKLGFLAQNAVAVDPDEAGCECHCDCVAVELPDIHPCISVAWGDSPCDCLETDDVEVLCITACNCYSNVTFKDFTISQIQICDRDGNPVATLPDGTPSVQAIPSGPICFGDIGPCTGNDRPGCVSRELVVYTRGAAGGKYQLQFDGICFDVCHHFQSKCVFTVKLCQD